MRLLVTPAAFPHPWAQIRRFHRGTWCANLIDCIKKTYGRLRGLGIRNCTFAETRFSWERKSLDGWKTIFVWAWSGGRACISKRGRASDRDLWMWRDRGRKSRRDASGTKERMQDSGVMAFKGWDDFQDVMIEFLA